MAATGKEVRKTCPTCAHSWLDKYGKPECPKCLAPLGAGAGVAKRAPGEASTFKASAGSAMESASGDCPKGGQHTWKYGKCNKCGLNEGYGKGAAAPRTKVPGGACTDGRMHVFKFGKCSKCGKSEF